MNVEYEVAVRKRPLVVCYGNVGGKRSGQKASIPGCFFYVEPTSQWYSIERKQKRFDGYLENLPKFR